jgi:hypothetical protein
VPHPGDACNDFRFPGPDFLIDRRLVGQAPAGLGDERAVLIVAHPGHELRVHGWLELARPTVCVLTDGSGHSAPSRLASTTAVLGRAGARPGPVYGRLTDRALYAAVLAGDAAPLVRLTAEIAEFLIAGHVSQVVGDALEGYNPAHDLCRVLIEASVELVGRRVSSWDFALTGPPAACPDGRPAPPRTLTLDDAAFARKLAAAREYRELAGEVQSALSSESPGAFRHEWLRPVDAQARDGTPPEDPPYYERHGERRVADGRYAEVLRWRTHVAPVVHSLRTKLGLEVT